MFVIREADGVNFYDGYVVKGKRSGFGRCVFKNASADAGGFFEGEYIGEWAKDKRHGIGTQILKVCRSVRQGCGRVSWVTAALHHWHTP